MMRSWWCLVGEMENQYKNFLAAKTGIDKDLELMVLLSVSEV